MSIIPNTEIEFTDLSIAEEEELVALVEKLSTQEIPYYPSLDEEEEIRQAEQDQEQDQEQKQLQYEISTLTAGHFYKGCQYDSEDGDFDTFCSEVDAMYKDEDEEEQIRQDILHDCLVEETDEERDDILQQILEEEYKDDIVKVQCVYNSNDKKE